MLNFQPSDRHSVPVSRKAYSCRFLVSFFEKAGASPERIRSLLLSLNQIQSYHESHELQHDRGIIDKSRMNYILKKARCSETLLDVGCGDGHYLSRLKDCHIMIGVDAIGLRINRARKKVDRRVAFVRCDAEFLPFRTSSMNTVICAEILEHVYDPNAVLEEISRVSCKDSLVLVSVPSVSLFKYLLSRVRGGSYYLDPATHLREYSSFKLDQFETIQGLEHSLALNHLRQIRIKGFGLLLDYAMYSKVARLNGTLGVLLLSLGDVLTIMPKLAQSCCSVVLECTKS